MNRRTWVNFKELRARLRFEDVLRHYGVELNSKGEQHQGPCPLPSHSGSRKAPSFSANLERGIYRCWSCKSQGNQLEFACRMTGNEPSDPDALRAVAVELQKKFLTRGPASSASERESDQSPRDASAIVNAALDFELKDLDGGHAYLSARGFSRETMRHFGVGFCSRGSLKGRVAIPLHDDGGRLVAYIGRAPTEAGHTDLEPKYRAPGRREMMGAVHELRTGLFLYNGHRLKEPAAALIVVIGLPAVWWLTQHGFPKVVATMGAAVSEEQADLVVRKSAECGCVWLMPPGTEAGQRFAEDMFRRVGPRRAVRWARLGDGRKPTDVPALTLKETFRL